MRKSLLFVALFLLTLGSSADNWMASLSDDVRLSRLSLPGAHDAGTGNGFEPLSELLGKLTGQTQQLSIAEQWDAGIRAFDLRPTLAYGELKIYHGIIETRLTFDDALATICSKLSENPTETAIVLMQNEGKSDDEEWGQYVAQSMAKVEDYLVNYTPGMTLGSVRGKLLIMNRSLFRPIPHGCVLQDWGVKRPDGEGNIESANGTTGIFHVQDYYDVTDYGASELKNQYVENMLRKSNNATNNDIFFNFTSGYTLLALVTGIVDNAVNTNTNLATILEREDNAYVSNGIVFMDFAGVDTFNDETVNGARLISALVACNENIPTYIADHTTSSQTNRTAAYNIYGMKVNDDAKGIIIKAGKKFVR